MLFGTTWKANRRIARSLARFVKSYNAMMDAQAKLAAETRKGKR